MPSLNKKNLLVVLIGVIFLLSAIFFLVRFFAYQEEINYYGNRTYGSGFWLTPDNANLSSLTLKKTYSGNLVSLSDVDNGYQFNVFVSGIAGVQSENHSINLTKDSYLSGETELYYFEGINLKNDKFTLDTFSDFIKSSAQDGQSNFLIEISLIEDYKTGKTYIDYISLFK